MDKEKYYTFIMLKPDAIKRNLTKDIIKVFKDNAYNIETFDYTKAVDEKIFDHYSEKFEEEGPGFKNKALATYHNEYVIPIILSNNSKNIIQEVREIVGFKDPILAKKDSIRGRWANDSMEISEKENRCCNNLIHASDSIEAFYKEINIWFDRETLAFLD